ncbi:MAG: response regulator transcription factor [Candidatus Aminicenantia bacterium]
MREEKILLVDFEGKSFNSIIDLLEEKGCKTITSIDGFSALQKFENENPDLVVLETELPKVHAFYFCQKIRREYKKDTPIIILTEDGSDNIKQEALGSYKVSAYFEKPYNSEELLKTIFSLLGKIEDKNNNEREEFADVGGIIDEGELPEPSYVIENILKENNKKITSEELFRDILEEI